MNDHELASMLALEAGNLLDGLQRFAASLPVSEDETERALGQEVLGDQGDEFAQQALATLLAQHRPDDVVLSEEADDTYESRRDASRVWIIDPLDGTTQFAMGKPDYAVHVALWQADSTKPGKIEAAAVYLPAFGVMLSTGDDVVLDVPDREAVRLLISRSRVPQGLANIVESLQERIERSVEVLPFGSVGAKVAQIINGAADLYLNLDGLNEWDIAAPLAVAVHYGLDVRGTNGKSLEFNQASTFVTGAVVGRTEFVGHLVDCLP